MSHSEGESPRWLLWAALLSGIASGYGLLLGLWLTLG
jgi:hypothetical protein